MTAPLSPLEALLLFQYLSSYGVSPSVFARISDLLNRDDQIRRAPVFDPARLAPDRLRDFYLRLLKEEVRNEVAASDSSGKDGANTDLDSGSRKRKAPSPSLPTIQEASQKSHLMPQLMRKLFARYREQAIVKIQEEEKRYEQLRRDIKDLQVGASDERLQHEIDEGSWDHLIKRVTKEDLQHEAKKTETQDPVPLQTNGPAKQSAVPLQPESPASAISAPAPTPGASTAIVAPAPTAAAISPRQPVQQLPQPQPPPPVSSPPRAHQPPPFTPQQPGSAPHSPYQSPQNSVTPRPHNAPTPARPTQPPSMLPPPPPPPPPTSAYPSQPMPPFPYDNNPQQQRLPPSVPVPPRAPPQTPQPPVPAAAVPYSPYAAPFQMPFSPAYPQQGGVMMQPFVVAPQTPSDPLRQTQIPPTVPNVRTNIPPRLQMGAVAPIQSQPGSLTPFDIASLLASPVVTRRLSAISGTSSSTVTRWRRESMHSAKTTRQSSPAAPRSVSPISERAPSPPTEPARRRRRGPPSVSAADGLPARSTRRRPRGGSTASSVPASSARDRTRSQSTVSHAEDISMPDNDSVSGRRVKHEPSTPMDSSDFIRPSTEMTPNQSTRRVALQSGLNKRKRGQSPASEASEIPPAPRQDKSVVIANRNFGRLSQTIMNDIQSHKHASLFSAPVRDRDAEGYSEIIKRPQDLKSIRAAITAGNRAVNAATASDSFASSTTSQRDVGGTVTLPASEDLIPPKAIVNSAQLEREVMRMLANAVMFNPGNEDVVQDAREMAERVERQIAEFRGVEGTSSQFLPTLTEGAGGARRVSEVDAAAVLGGTEDEDLGVGKRRKVG